MKRSTRTLYAGLAALLIGSTCLVASADARRLGGGRPHVRAHAAAHVARHNHRARVANRIHRRGHWVNGVWIATAVAAGAAAASNSCPYYWNQWKATGSAYWRDKYYGNCG